jgi:hypothetical protein
MNTAQLEEVKKFEVALALINDAQAAFVAIGDMMQPETEKGDEQLNLLRRSQAAAIFRFFGNSLEEPLRSVTAIKDRMEFASLNAI